MDDTENDGAPALFEARTDAGLDTCLAGSFAVHKGSSDRAWDRAFHNSSLTRTDFGTKQIRLVTPLAAKSSSSLSKHTLPRSQRGKRATLLDFWAGLSMGGRQQCSKRASPDISGKLRRKKSPELALAPPEAN
jgi:hypothetical protein